MTKKRSSDFSRKNRVTPISCHPGDTNPSDATKLITVGNHPAGRIMPGPRGTAESCTHNLSIASLISFTTTTPHSVKFLKLARCLPSSFLMVLFLVDTRLIQSPSATCFSCSGLPRSKTHLYTLLTTVNQ